MLEEGIPPTELLANQETMRGELSVTVWIAFCTHNTAVHYIEKAQYTWIALPQPKDPLSQRRKCKG